MDKQIKIYLDKIIKLIKNDYPLFKNLKIYGFYNQLTIDELNYVLSNIFQQPVKYLYYGGGIYNKNNRRIYYENSDGYWEKREFDKNREIIYSEDSDGYWVKVEYDENGNRIYWETSNGYWIKSEYDDNGNEVYFENSDGKIINNK
jgi:hypothetical protein